MLDPQDSPGDIKSREVESGLRKLDNPLLQLFLNSCATDIVETAVETAISGVH